MIKRIASWPWGLRWMTLALIAVMAAPLPGVFADDEDAYVMDEWSLSRLRTAELVGGPRICTPADFYGRVEDRNDGESVWDHFGAQPDWISFAGNEGGQLAVPGDVLMEILQTVHAELFESFEHNTLTVHEDRLEVMGRGSHVQSVRKTFDWAVDGLAPSVTVNAAYDVLSPEPRALAAGRARLLPRRWTRVFLQRAAQPFCIGFDIELAQESTAMDPVVVDLPEGQELYMRLHPGEAVSLVEVWCGEVEHKDQRTIDFSVIRNVPEANAPGIATFPVSRAMRAHTVLVLPNGKPAERRIRFRQDGRESILRMAFGAPPSAHPATRTSRPRPLALLRVDAAAGALDFDVRFREPDMWIESIISAALARGFEDDDLQMQHIASSGCVFAEGLPKALEFARSAIVASESRLVPRVGTLRVLTLAEPAYRKGVASKQIVIGQEISSEYVAELNGLGSANAILAQIPLLTGVDAGFRVGYSEPGLAEFNVEVAQTSAGMDPVTTAMFRGLSGMVRVDRAGRSQVLRLRGTLEFADPEAGTIDLTFRPPVGMNLQHDRWLEEPDGRRKVTLPTIGGASTAIDAEAVITRQGRLHVLDVVVRGGEAHLILGSVRPL